MPDNKKGVTIMDPRKTIKVLAILALVFGIIGVIGSLLMLVGGGAITAVSQNEQIMSEVANDQEVANAVNDANNALGTDMDAATATASTGVMVIIVALISLISAITGILEGVFGLKAANGKGAKPAFIFGIVEIVLAAIGLIASGFSSLFGSVISIVIAALYTYCAKQILDEENGAQAE